MSNPKWWDANGLKCGDIPVGTRCSFRDECLQQNDTCPPDGIPTEHPHSCAVARLRSLARLYPKGFPSEEKEKVVDFETLVNNLIQEVQTNDVKRITDAKQAVLDCHKFRKGS